MQSTVDAGLLAQIAGVIAVVAGALFAAIPHISKLFSAFRQHKLEEAVGRTQLDIVDGLQESLERQFKSQEARFAQQQAWMSAADIRMQQMDHQLHAQTLKVTRLVMLVIQLRATMAQQGIFPDPRVQREIDSLTGMPADFHSRPTPLSPLDLKDR